MGGEFVYRLGERRDWREQSVRGATFGVLHPVAERYGTRSRSGDCCRGRKFGRVFLSFSLSFSSSLSVSLSLSSSSRSNNYASADHPEVLLTSFDRLAEKGSPPCVVPEKHAAVRRQEIIETAHDFSRVDPAVTLAANSFFFPLPPPVETCHRLRGCGCSSPRVSFEQRLRSLRV